MKKTANILGFVGAALVIMVAAVVAIVYGIAEAQSAFVWVIVPVVIGSGVVFVAVLALAAVSYAETRPVFSSALYFIASGLGLIVLWITGLLLIGLWGHALMLAVVPLLVAGVLTYKDRNRTSQANCSNTVQ